MLSCYIKPNRRHEDHPGITIGYLERDTSSKLAREPPDTETKKYRCNMMQLIIISRALISVDAQEIM